MIINANSIEIPLADCSVHMCVITVRAERDAGEFRAVADVYALNVLTAATIL